MIDTTKYQKDKAGKELEEVVEDARELAIYLGLNPRPVNYWIVDYDEMNQLMACGSFPERYPHWRWGMKYDNWQKKGEYGGGKAYEIVNNDNPCNAFLQVSNNISEQKSVITHVEAHADFFENNEWYQDDVNSSDMLARHAEKIEEYMEDPDIDREEVEKWIDHLLCLEDTIDQYSDYVYRDREESDDGDDENDSELNIDVGDDIKDYFSDDGSMDHPEIKPRWDIGETSKDVLAFLMKNGKQYSKLRGEAVDFEDWQVDIIDMLREEFYLFAPQKMTKIINEGWAKYWESVMMTNEGVATSEDIIEYADQSSKVLNSPGLNPYKLGKALWEHVENTVNRNEVVDKLLRVDGVDANTFKNEIDFQYVHDCLDKRQSGNIVERNYSLTRPDNQHFLKNISGEQLERTERYIADHDKYNSIEEALDDVDYEAGWRRMREIRETHNDVMFIDEFLTQEFVDDQQYFTFEYRTPHQEMQIASRDVEDVKKKLLLSFTNFGKPTIEAASANFNNKGELLLLHKFNGVGLDLDKATSILERIFEMWGRPVNLATIGKMITEEELDYSFSENVEPHVETQGVRIRYDGEDFSEHDISQAILDVISADDIDYSTKPEEWL